MKPLGYYKFLTIEMTYLRRFLILVILSLLAVRLSAQLPIENTELFSIKMKADTVHFIKISESGEKIKPTLIYLNGSQPVPLILVDDERGPMVSFTGGFDYKEISRRYHIIMISKPCTPIIKNLNELNNAGAYPPDISKPDEFDERYLERNYLEYYVEETEAVIEFLKNQTWVDKDRIILFGFSQGAHIAAHVAMRSEDILALGHGGGNVMGRFSQVINDVQNLAKKGEISAEEAQDRTNYWYKFWRETSRDSLWRGGDPPHTWMSFSNQYIDKFVQIKIPIFIAYGTEDPGAQQNVMLPIYFELAGKTNYVMRPFIGCDHGLTEILSDGSEKWHFGTLMDEFIQWCDDIIKSLQKADPK